MHSPDDKQYPLGQPKRARLPRRAVSNKDFSLPKPYRRQLFCEEPDRLTRLQISLLAFAGLLIATLTGVLALLAHESERSPQGKVIVAAARLESAEQVEARLASFPAPTVRIAQDLPPAPRTRPVVKARPIPKELPPVTPKMRPAALPALAFKKAAPAARAPVAVPARDKKRKPAPRREAPQPVPVRDPDEDLITAILLLTPAPLRAAPASTESLVRPTQICTGTVVKDDCVDVHKIKH